MPHPQHREAEEIPVLINGIPITITTTSDAGTHICVNTDKTPEDKREPLLSVLKIMRFEGPLRAREGHSRELEYRHPTLPPVDTLKTLGQQFGAKIEFCKEDLDQEPQQPEEARGIQGKHVIRLAIALLIVAAILLWKT